MMTMEVVRIAQVAVEVAVEVAVDAAVEALGGPLRSGARAPGPLVVLLG